LFEKRCDVEHNGQSEKKKPKKLAAYRTAPEEGMGKTNAIYY